MIKFIACDMDGTLVDDEKVIHEKVFSTLDYLKSKNIIFCAASGRQYNSLKHIFGEHGKDMLFIAENGSYVVYKDKEIFSTTMKEDLWKKIAHGSMKQEGLKPVLCCRDSIYTDDIKTAEVMSTPKFGYNVNYVEDILSVKDEIIKITVMDDNPYKNKGMEFLQKSFGNETEIAVSGFGCIDIMNKGISKGTAINQILKNFGIDKNEAAAFGDNFNDIEMLKEVGYSFAMKNSVDEIKSHAKFVTKYTNNECGVVREIEELIQKGII